MSRNIVFEGWLTKSPPTKRIWRTKWRRRWFALRQSGELPGQYFLDYYADRNCRRLKGTINLDLCEQVDAGLHMERTGNGTLDPKLRGSVFTIQTQQRTYHLEADCEADMERWVDAICRVCGLRSTEESALDNFQTSICMTTLSALNEQNESNDTGPYIPISECITGVRTQDTKAFTFDPKTIVISTRTPLERVSNNRNQKMYMSQPQIRLNQTELSENDSNPSEDDAKSLTASQSNIRDWSVAKTFTKLSINQKRNGLSSVPPEPPPRPPKTLRDYQGARIQELVEVHDANQTVRRSKRSPRQTSPIRMFTQITPARVTDDEDESHNQVVEELRNHRPILKSPSRPICEQPRFRTDEMGPVRSILNGKLTPPCLAPCTQLVRVHYSDDEDESYRNTISWLRPKRRISLPKSPCCCSQLKRVRFTDEENILPCHNMGLVPAASSSRELAEFKPPGCYDDDDWSDYQMGLMRSKRSPLPTTSSHHFGNQVVPRYTDDEDDSHHHQSLQYCNLSTLSAMPLPVPIHQPPAVDRALKPRHSSIGHINHILGQGLQSSSNRDTRNDALQYLDLDLRSSDSSLSKPCEVPQQKKPVKEICHGKTMSAVETESDSAYKTVDFLKTEAFNITRQDAEASRSTQTEFK